MHAGVGSAQPGTGPGWGFWAVGRDGSRLGQGKFSAPAICSEGLAAPGAAAMTVAATAAAARARIRLAAVRAPLPISRRGQVTRRGRRRRRYGVPPMRARRLLAAVCAVLAAVAVAGSGILVYARV